MLDNFDEMKAKKGIKKFDLDGDMTLYDDKTRVHFNWYKNDLFNIIRDCNDDNVYGVVKMLGKHVVIEPNKYENDTLGIHQMIEELRETVIHMIKTDQAKAFADGNVEQNDKLTNMMMKMGLTPANKDNTRFYEPVKDLTELDEEWLMQRCAIYYDDMERHHKNNPVEDFERGSSALSKFAFQMQLEAQTYYERYEEVNDRYYQVGGVPILATHDTSLETIRNVALNNETVKLLKNIELNLKDTKENSQQPR
jgi:hypothetical protein